MLVKHLLNVNNLKDHREVEAIEGLLRLQETGSFNDTPSYQRQEGSCCFITNRRGRPPRDKTSKQDSSLKMLNLTASQYARHVNETTKVQKRMKNHPTNKISSSTTNNNNKPRWQDHERQDLLEAIVRVKSLDDMATIPWDAISKSVGRAKKACKDQWRRELLPYLIDGLFANNNSSTTMKLSKYNNRKKKE
ncbi:uncharacterized protein BX663DRAFT_509447 [Cokeromyces recurvatus]|uniref:uncharacterized protein n=1 Tax=Cokeromyces recurvatus TaxID=90255 RepID=UPI00221F50B2|nr:uncharacterized protein BX663DRAFT_509447 [Cokeromyces recurvatus]KAI7903069.1 hypothetical protein BX663DRAFT_509447 [Cokeromyces recurvatus]